MTRLAASSIAEVLADRLAGHLQSRAELAQGLAVAAVQAVEQLAAARIGERAEGLVDLDLGIGSHLAAYIRQPSGCLSSGENFAAGQRRARIDSSEPVLTTSAAVAQPRRAVRTASSM